MEQNDGKKEINLTINDTIVVDYSDFLDLEIRQSKIKGGGDGLFAKIDFEEDDILSEYRGKIIKSEYCNHDLYCWEDKMVGLL